MPTIITLPSSPCPTCGERRVIYGAPGECLECILYPWQRFPSTRLALEVVL